MPNEGQPTAKPARVTRMAYIDQLLAQQDIEDANTHNLVLDEVYVPPDAKPTCCAEQGNPSSKISYQGHTSLVRWTLTFGEATRRTMHRVGNMAKCAECEANGRVGNNGVTLNKKLRHVECRSKIA